LFREELVDESRIDEAVINLFTSRMKLGSFDKNDDNPYDKIPYSVVDSKEMRDLNREVSAKSIVLLKNENNILPLNKDEVHTIGVIGPNANSRNALVGNYEGTASRYVTVLEGIQDYVGEDVRVLYSEGCHLYKDRTSNLAEANDRESEVRGVCSESDVIIAVMGMDATLEGEEGDTGNEYGSGDKPNLRLPGLQHDILKVAKEYGKPVILVVLCGSATALTWEQDNLDAILQGWYPGAQGGKAIADILFGSANPQGKLPVTFYRTTRELPNFEDYSMKGRTYRYMTQDALYPFGYGLSYTDYEYSNVKFGAASEVRKGVDIECTVKNIGCYDGTETIQVYIKAKKEGTPNAQLKAVKKVELKAGEEKDITVHLPCEAFTICNENGTPEYINEGYVISVGGSQPDKRSAELTGNKVTILEI
jgi:beta-glucosidase